MSKKMVKIGNEKYLLGDNSIKNSGECYKINDRLYLKDDEAIVWDCEEKKYVQRLPIHVYGIIGINDKTKRFKFGHFINRDKVKLVVNDLKNPIWLLDESIITETPYFNKYTYSKITDTYYSNHLDLKFSSDDMLSIRDGAKTFYNYSVSSRLLSTINNLTEQYDSLNGEIVERTISDVIGLNINNVLQNLTFGAEFETSKGFLPTRINRRLPLIPLRDGSIDGFEYATSVLKGHTGIGHLINICDALKKYTEYDKHCSMHFHVGGLPRTEKHIVAMYIVTAVIQNELFDINPHYKFSHYGVKRKNYSKPYDIDLLRKILKTNSVSNAFELLFDYMSPNAQYHEYDCKLDNVEFHIDDPNGNRKWNVPSRYHVVNLIPIIFGNKKTVEFRIHQSSFNKEVVIYELLINLALVKFVINNTDAIIDNKIPINLRYILTRTFERSTSSILCEYIDRKKSIKKYASREGMLSFNIDDYVDFQFKNMNVNIPYLPKNTLNFSKQGFLIEGILNDEINQYRSRVGIDKKKSTRGIYDQIPQFGQPFIIGEDVEGGLDRAVIPEVNVDRVLKDLYTRSIHLSHLSNDELRQAIPIIRAIDRDELSILEFLRFFYTRLTNLRQQNMDGLNGLVNPALYEISLNGDDVLVITINHGDISRFSISCLEVIDIFKGSQTILSTMVEFFNNNNDGLRIVSQFSSIYKQAALDIIEYYLNKLENEQR